MLALPSAHAANTWSWSGGDSNWNNNAANWTSNHVPLAGEDVVINGASVELTNDTPILRSLLVTNSAKLYIYAPMTNGATAWGLLVNVTGDLSIAGSSWIYPYSHNTNGGSPWFLCSNLVVDATSGFNANAAGYRGGVFAVEGIRPPGHGPGRSLGTDYGTPGAGYGGMGGLDGSILAPGGSTYGSSTNPADPGSGSGGANVHTAGRPGGGLVRVLAADSVLVDGSVLANGQSAVSGYPGSGSGGGIYIQCRTFRGSGLLTAVGGHDMYNSVNQRNGGSGGGGRIAVIFDPAAQAGVPSQPTVRFNAAGGNRTVAGPSVRLARQSQGRPGSLYLTTNTFFSFSNVQGGEIMVPGVMSLTTNTLLLTNDLVAFPTGFSLTVSQNVSLTNAGGIDLSNSTVTIGGDLILNSDRRASVYLRGGPGQQISIGTNINVTKGWIDIDQQGMANRSLSIAGGISLNDANLNVWGPPTNVGSLSVGGSILATNTTLIYLYSGMTNGPTNHSLSVNAVGDITIASNCWIYPYSHYTNGGSIHFRALTLTVGGGGGINASQKGFAGGIFGLQGSRGFGLGAPASAEGGNNPGGGYGGQGGRTAASTGGPTYGSSNAPIDPGSGGAGTTWGSYAPGGYGGGLIHFEASTTVIVDGSLLADGQGTTGYNGAGSGGGIYVSCRTFKGSANGLLSANGGAAPGGQTTGSGGGGGGRIAVWSLKPTNDWFGVAQVNGGAGKYTAGTNGTIFWGRLRDAGTVFVVH